MISALMWRVKCIDLSSSLHYLSSIVHSPTGLHSPDPQGAETLLPPWILSVFLAHNFSVACIYICCHFRNLEVPIFKCVRTRKWLQTRIWIWPGLEKGSRYLHNLLRRTGLTKCFLILQFQLSFTGGFLNFSPRSTLFLKSLCLSIQHIYCCYGTF